MSQSSTDRGKEIVERETEVHGLTTTVINVVSLLFIQWVISIQAVAVFELQTTGRAPLGGGGRADKP